MMQTFPESEARVVALLQKERVLTMEAICAGAGCCRMTAFRGLKRYGYFNSYNCNSGYFTLHDTPQFDARGLWQYDAARFSRYGTIARTVLAWVDGSPCGVGLGELATALGVDVHCHTGGLVRAGELARMRVGRRVVYLSGAAARRAAQEAAFGEETRAGVGGERSLPPGLTAPVVLRLLVAMIREPQASEAVLAQRVSAQGERLTVEGVRAVTAWWRLDEKKGSCG
jgi:hypothetical protein